MNANLEDPILELVIYKFCFNLTITGQYTKNQIFLDQDWADHAVTKFCGDVVMNQWSNVFYFLTMAFQICHLGKAKII